MAIYMLVDIIVLKKKIDKGTADIGELKRMHRTNKLLEQGRVTYPIYFLVTIMFGVPYLVIVHVELLIRMIKKQKNRVNF